MACLRQYDDEILGIPVKNSSIHPCERKSPRDLYPADHSLPSVPPSQNSIARHERSHVCGGNYRSIDGPCDRRNIAQRPSFDRASALYERRADARVSQALRGSVSSCRLRRSQERVARPIRASWPLSQFTRSSRSNNPSARRVPPFPRPDLNVLPTPESGTVGDSVSR